ncbi:unnamed protein product [Sphenostylis stenocarpa]|uniref:Uncharacterized protein n=1 Tax=Sphenostylis stenocarpa TaxID=92480 RepID=A0AA86VHE7_9FABA|nr:unnamed protein product [Sphenostylis stenocarpa]
MEIYHGVSAVAETDRGTRYPSGRKMMSRIVFSKVEEAENGTNVAKNLTTKWNHEEGKGILNVKQHKVGKRNSGHSKKANMSALNLHSDKFKFAYDIYGKLGLWPIRQCRGDNDELVQRNRVLVWRRLSSSSAYGSEQLVIRNRKEKWCGLRS